MISILCDKMNLNDKQECIYHNDIYLYGVSSLSIVRTRSIGEMIYIYILYLFYSVNTRSGKIILIFV